MLSHLSLYFVLSLLVFTAFIYILPITFIVIFFFFPVRFSSLSIFFSLHCYQLEQQRTWIKFFLFTWIHFEFFFSFGFIFFFLSCTSRKVFEWEFLHCLGWTFTYPAVLCVSHCSELLTHSYDLFSSQLNSRE